MKIRFPAAVALFLCCALASGQGTIYESKDKEGPVFSDQPSPGARELHLPPPNVIETDRPPEMVRVPAPAPAAQGSYYRGLGIASPAEGDTIHSNTGEFAISAQIAPALRETDRIRVKLDGNLLSTNHRSTAIPITADDWRAAAGDSVEHTLQLSVVDDKENVLIESAVTRVFVHRATGGGGRR